MAPTRAEKAEKTEAEQAESVAEKLEGKSRQAGFSNYNEVDPPETNPPSGRLVEQELGEPREGPVPRFGEE